MKNTLFCFVISMFLSNALLMPFLAAANNGTGDDSSENGSWSNILRTRTEELHDYFSQIDLYEEMLRKASRELEQVTSETETRNHQIRFLFLNNVMSPYHYRLMRKEYYRNISKFRTQLDQVRIFKKSNERYSDLLNNMLGDIRSLEAKPLNQEDLNVLKELNATLAMIAARLEKAGRIIKTTLEPAEKLSSNLESQEEELRNEVPDKMKHYFLQKNRRIFTYSTAIVINDLKLWAKRYLRSMQERLPNNLADYKDLLLLLILAGIPIYLLLRRSVVKICKSADIPHKGRSVLLRSFLSAVPAFILFIYGLLMVPFPENIITSRLSVILGTLAFMDFAWALSIIRAKDLTPSYSPLLPVFLIYALNVSYEILDLSIMFLFLIWPLTLILFMEPLRQVKNKELPRLEKNLASISFWGVFIAMAISLLGYLFLSILLVFAFLIFSIGLQLASNMSYFSNRLIVEMQKAIRSDLLKVVILGLGVPVIWSGILVISAFWFADQLVDPIAVLQLLGTGIAVFGINLNILRLISGIFLFFVFKTVTSVIHNILEHVRSNSVDASTVHSLKSVSSYVLWCIYCVALLYLIGFSLTSLTVIAGGLSLGIGFGLQHIVNNFISGLLIIFGGTVRQGDIIQMDNIMAKVLEINVRSTTIQTMDNALIAVPNSDMLNTKIINWTRNDLVVKKEIKIGVAYGSDVEKVRSVLMEAARNHQNVLKSPEPVVWFSQFGNSTLDFSLFVWIDNINIAGKVISDLNYTIDRRSREENIVMAFPQLEISVKNQTRSNASI